MAYQEMYNDATKLDYEIHKFSSYSTLYLPENIREDCPSDQTSRWSSNTNCPPQFITLRLRRPSIVSCVKFGKHEKTHVCNLKKFQIFGGLQEEHMALLYEGGLKNDSTAEVLRVATRSEEGELSPVLFIKIVPLLSWGPSFNFSIWYVELLGKDDPLLVRSTLQRYSMLREQKIVRLCLKHFRQQGYEEAFAALQLHTKVPLENPVMSAMHRTLVVEGDFARVECIVEQFVDDGLVDEYLGKHKYQAVWTQQPIVEEARRPGMRGGHQLIIDSTTGLMYLFGGWDGFEDLSDMWQYDIRTNDWSLIHERSELVGGPGPRSCHKMLFDQVNSQIFALGKYLDGASRSKENLNSDFYLFNTKTSAWLQICDDTSQVGGPQLMFDHQMCIDSEKNTIYVFGGRILTPRNIDDLSTDMQYSGLFAYHIATNTWTQILVDCGHPSAASPDVASIKSRVTHSMLFHHHSRKLYIFGGQRNKEYTTDFMSFDVDTLELTIDNTETNRIESGNMPQSGFTQRATIDCDRNEIYVLSSLSKEKERRDLNLNSFWMYSLQSKVWRCIYRSDHSTEQCVAKAPSSCSEPCPRYAHQLVYDHQRKVHYLFGGNPGNNSSPQLRLDDFWILRLRKPSRSQILQQCKFLVRKQQYEETAKEDAVQAIHFLQTRLSDTVDHEDPIQLAEFHKLASLLFQNDNQTSGHSMSGGASANDQAKRNDCGMETDSDTASSTDLLTDDETVLHAEDATNTPTLCVPRQEQKDRARRDDVKTSRCLLFNRLMDMLPTSMVQPKENISDFLLV